MIRWKFLCVRLTVLCVLFLIFQWATPWAAKWGLILTARKVSSTDLDIDRLGIDWLRGTSTVEGLSLVDPRAPDRNLVDVDSTYMRVDMAALAQKRYVVEEAFAEGVRISTPNDSGQREHDEQLRQVEAVFSDKVSEYGQQWLDRVTDRLEQDLEDDFQSVQLARDLKQRWPDEYQRLSDDAEQWQSRYQQLQPLAENPKLLLAPEHIAKIPEYLAQIDQAVQEIQRLKQELPRLRQQLAADRVAVNRALEHDKDVIRDKARLDELNTEELNHYLVGPELARRWEQVRPWVSTATRLMSSPKLNHKHSRGRLVDLLGTSRMPSTLIKLLKFNGEAPGDRDELISFSGQLTNLTTEPQVLGIPTELRLKTAGPAPVQLHARLDRTRETAHDSVEFLCPKLRVDARSLGKPDTIAIELPSGEASVRGTVSWEAEQIRGRIHFRQEGLTLATRVGDKFGGESVGQSLSQSLAHVHQVNLTADLKGHWLRPSIRLDSNLASELKTGLQTALRAELTRRAELVALKTDQQVGRELSQLESMIQVQQAKLAATFDLNQQQLEGLKQTLLSDANPLKDWLPKNLSKRELFRKFR